MADQVNVGSILKRTFGTIQPNAGAIAIYVTGLSAIGIAIGIAGSNADGIYSSAVPGAQFGLSVASIIAQYVLLEHMLKTEGLMSQTGPKRFVAYIGQNILAGLGIVLGLVLLVIPGLILAARWSAAAPLLIAQQKPVMESLRESWDLTRGHTVPLVLAIVVIGLIAIAAIAVIVVVPEDGGVASIIVGEVIGNSVTVLTSAFAVAVFGLVHSPIDHLSEVFE